MTLDPVFVHQIFGALVLAFAMAVLLRSQRVIHGYWSEYPPTSALVVLGALLFADPGLFHGGNFGARGFSTSRWESLPSWRAGSNGFGLPSERRRMGAFRLGADLDLIRL
jgi:hypothetical protein